MLEKTLQTKKKGGINKMINSSDLIKKNVYKEYKSLINMNKKELLDFISDKKSICGRRNERDNRLVKRNRFFINKSFKNWNFNDIVFAMKIINRIKTIKRNEYKGRVGCLSLKTVKLMNFGHNPNKKNQR